MINADGSGATKIADASGPTDHSFYNLINGSPAWSPDATKLASSATTDTSNQEARAQALRQVAEDADLHNAEFNRAFVLMQYFGYLRRNPNDAPDSDFSGYNFWLHKLNSFNGNYINAEMVKAFLFSQEYRSRYGQP